MLRWLSLWAVAVTTLCATAPGEEKEPAFEEPTGELTLERAVQASLAGNPRLQAFSWDLRAADARILQAGLRPNPDLAFTAEDIRWRNGPGTVSRSRSLGGAFEPDGVTIPAPGGATVDVPVRSFRSAWDAEKEREDGPRSGFREAEFTLSLSQTVELGGKRAKRVAVAREERSLVAWDFEAVRADVLAETGRAFVEVLVAQRALILQRDLVDLAGQVAHSISQRVDAGQVSPLEQNRSAVALSLTSLGLERATRDLEIARARLAATWGGTQARFEKVVGDLETLAPLPSVVQLKEAIEHNPDLARWASELALRDSRFAHARAQRMPDPSFEIGLRLTGQGDRSGERYALDSSLGLGYSTFDIEPDSNWDRSLLFGFSLPLPIFNRNQGSIAEAEALVSKVADERRWVETLVRRDLTEARERGAGAYEEARRLRDEVIAEATDTLTRTEEGYELGKFGYLDVLDAQRALFDARTTYLEALRRYHLAIVDLERLTGGSPKSLAESEKESSHD